MIAGLALGARRGHGDEHDATAIASARARLARWLLEGGAQLTTGVNAGGVAGWLDGAGNAAYVYPEITGYYLQWLAWQAAGGQAAAVVAHRAAAAQRWLAVWIARTDPPYTRVYLPAHAPDWRNGAMFFFDLAMVVRGVASAARAQLIDANATLVRALVAHLSTLVDSDGMFVACASATRGTQLPDRWSTRRGGFLAKAAAGVLAAAEVLPSLASLRAPAQATLSASLKLAIEQPHAEAHPALYAMEGALSAPDRGAVVALLPRFVSQVESMIGSARVTGMLHESRVGSGVDRLDIVAQVLRAAALVGIQAIDGSQRAQTLADMAQLLARCTRTTGALPFSPSARIPQYNAWCAMFAEQALSVAHPASRAPALARLAALLV